MIVLAVTQKTSGYMSSQDQPAGHRSNQKIETNNKNRRNEHKGLHAGVKLRLQFFTSPLLVSSTSVSLLAAAALTSPHLPPASSHYHLSSQLSS
jgi:hypothetical protein